ncbi:MAG: hypothetical protein JO286_17235 [Solirubrobacterales bacterium]|nr:hypothetical protein [Solirubrobacterales bacterium]
MQRSRGISIVAASVFALAVFLVSAGSALGDSGAGKLALDDPLCASQLSVCADPHGLLNGYYVGHDEPSVEFKSNVPGSGNDVTYLTTLPKDPATQPNASGANSTTWNFQLRATHWFGMTLCDSESAPEFTKKCTPDSDKNDLTGTNPRSANYIGKHPGNAYMELQFYPPGYVEQFEGFGCTATQYCAAMTIDSRTLDQNHGDPGSQGTENAAACNAYILGGPEPINWAYVTRSGRSQAPANPLFTGTGSNPNFTAVNPDPSQDLMMNPGDRILVHMHDTPAGFQVNLVDLSTRQTGSMTASIANGFGHILFTPNSSTCQEAPYAFHPEYSTANARGNTWSVHTYNVAMSDELGHFENCLALSADLNCTQPGSQDAGGLDEDDDNNFCVPGTDSTLVHIDGCFSADFDWDNQSYRNDWPGTNPDPSLDRALHPTPILFTSPLTVRGTRYRTIAFETDLPQLEASQDNPPLCDVNTGANCTVPPQGASFYPFFTTGIHDGICQWQEGGNFIPDTIDHFGGSAAAEYGQLLRVVFPVPGFTTVNPISDFNSGDRFNPC